MKNRTLLLLILIVFFATGSIQKKLLQQPKDTQPIKTIMQRLMMDMQTIEVGIWNENYDTIWSGANNIVNHPKIPLGQRKEIAGILGKKMKAFVALDKQVHNHADSLAQDAKAKNMNEILKHYSIIQQGCVSCHANFRTKIIGNR
ncbi:cytochrome c [Fodinibius sediminis]|uniref:Cytochrome C n=1 Tax=Fodinibius sediminis TaxID=1214077 RepID=A0A521F027_9BACT|nr:cytochrome c [Fodinibius sediminis]SMO88780.1 Cytochrome C' [Fodinibius sediminis]